MVRVTKETRQAVEDACWAIAMRLETFGYAEISVEAGISFDRASEIVRGWYAAGRCELVQSGHRLRKLYRARTAGSARPSRRGSVPQNLWTTMRGLKAFTPTDLAAHSTTDTVEVTTAAAQAYCQTLLRAGYLKVERKAVPGRREAIYRLIKATGPRPPRERRVRAVFDENLGEFVHIGGGTT